MSTTADKVLEVKSDNDDLATIANSNNTLLACSTGNIVALSTNTEIK